MTENKLSRYFDRHKSQLQAVWFLIFGLAAMIAQLGSRVICNLAFQGMDHTVNIWPFPSHTLGSFLAFLISNILAKVISYITNRKKTFQANNTWEEIDVDSLDMFEIIMTLEDEFGIELPEKEFDGVKTVGDLISIIQKKSVSFLNN